MSQLVTLCAFTAVVKAARLDLFVMSRCPDAWRCQQGFLPGLLRQLGSHVELHVNYIAELDASERSGVRCLHGRAECEGNIHQLCVQRHYPRGTADLEGDGLSPPHHWTRFLRCAARPIGGGAGGFARPNESAIPDNTGACLDSLLNDGRASAETEASGVHAASPPCAGASMLARRARRGASCCNAACDTPMPCAAMRAPRRGKVAPAAPPSSTVRVHA